MILTMLLSASVGILAPGASELQRLMLEGPDMHESLVTEQIEAVEQLHVPRAVLQGNPQLSSDANFMEAIARGGSQGQLDSQKVRAALYALYRCEKEVGFYGLEVASDWDADLRESQLRGIWVKNVSGDRARIYRNGRVLLVVWHDGVPSSCWKAVTEVVAERLSGE